MATSGDSNIASLASLHEEGDDATLIAKVLDDAGELSIESAQGRYLVLGPLGALRRSIGLQFLFVVTLALTVAATSLVVFG